MTAPSLQQTAVSLASSVGRYFSVVTVLPSTLLTSYTFVLIASGAWSGRPDWASAARELAGLSLGQVAALLVVVLTIGVVSHPLQFALVQLLEGYWGSGAMARQFRRWRTASYVRRFFYLKAETERLEGELPEEEPSDEDLTWITAVVDHDEFTAERGNLPTGVERVMATRLGNMLRRYEDMAGDRFGLDAVMIIPHIALVAPPEHVRYLDDCRANLDLAVRVCATCLLACLLSVVFLVVDGRWLLIACIPYSLAYLAYCGVVVAPRHYGIALGVVVDLNRFRLYEQLRVRAPGDSSTEFTANEKLTGFLRGERERINYVSRPPADGPP
jgi:hypothetical protein